MPPVKTAAADAKMSTGLGDMTSVFGMLKNTKLACDLALSLAHEHLLRPRIGSLWEMSREYRHIYTRWVVAGMAFVQGKLKMETFATSVWQPVFLTALAATLVFLVLAVVRQAAPNLLPEVFDVGASRSNLAILRLANFTCDLFVVIWLLTVGVNSTSPLWRRCGGALRIAFSWRPLVFLGQHSLPVYTYHVLAVYLFLTFVDFRSMPPLWKEPVPFLGALSLFVPAWLHAQYLRSRGQ